MKIKVNGRELWKALENARKLADAKYVVIETLDDGIVVWCTDYDFIYKQYLAGDVISPGLVSIIYKYVKLLRFKGEVSIYNGRDSNSDEAITIFSDSDKKVEINNGDYFSMNELLNDMSVNVDCDVPVMETTGDKFKDVMNRVKYYAASDKEPREILRSVYWDFNKKSVVATNGSVLAKIDMPILMPDDGNLLLHVNWGIIKQISDKATVSVRISRPGGDNGEVSAVMEISSYVDGTMKKQILFKAMDKDYVDYNRVIPESRPGNGIEVNQSSLITFVKLLKEQGIKDTAFEINSDGSVNVKDFYDDCVNIPLKEGTAPFALDYKLCFALDTFKRGISAIRSDIIVYPNEEMIYVYGSDCLCIVMQYRCQREWESS